MTSLRTQNGIFAGRSPVVHRSTPYLWISAAFVVALTTLAQVSTVTGRVTWERAGGSQKSTTGSPVVVVWLTPLSQQRPEVASQLPARHPRIIQRNKRFETRVLAIEAGTTVDFPNLDPFFHNVFSLFNGERFDLGLYEAGSSKSVRFEKPGVCFIFCNIHSEMSATVVVVDTPYFVTLNGPGDFQVNQVPSGRYRLNIWAERSSPEVLDAASREITVSTASTSVGTIRLLESEPLVDVHSNKYGKSYDLPVFSGPIYTQP